MKGKIILPALLLLMGLGVGMVSLYEASVAGLMRQVGLVGADFGATVIKDNIEGLVGEMGEQSNCSLLDKARGAVGYTFFDLQNKEGLAFELGEERLRCGVRMLANEKVKEGTYEILKGLGYIKQGYAMILEKLENGSEVCQQLPGEELAEMMTKIIFSTNGKVNEIIAREWQQIDVESRVVKESCFAKDGGMR